MRRPGAQRRAERGDQRGAIVGDPSQKKSPAMNAAAKALGRLIAKAVQAHADATAAAKSDKVVNEVKEKVIADKIKAAVKAEKYEELEQLKAELTGQAAASKEDEPILRRFKTNDPTVEKLGEYCVRTRRAPLHAR